MVSMNKLSTADRVRVIAALVEGNSIRSTVRMAGVAKNTVTKLLVELGAACSAYLGEHVKNIRARRIQCDEIWSFVGCKQKNVQPGEEGERGDVWTWTALDPETKLIVSYLVGSRDSTSASVFVHDLAGRLASRVQLTTDGHKVYLDAVDDAFAGEIDYAMLIKVYENGNPGAGRYSPAKHINTVVADISGTPERRHVSTSHVERQNLTMRMSMRRFTRLTNAFSKKMENHAAAVGLHFMYYNFCRIHQTLRVTPAMAAGLTDHVWELEELVALLG